MASQRAVVLTSLLFSGFAQAQTVPTLRYDPPASYYRSAIMPPEDYSSSEVNASFQVYPFRAFSGDIQQAFQQTLLREWIDPRYRESNVAAPPAINVAAVPGAEAVLIARFQENIAGLLQERMRLLIVAKGMAALVHISANSAATWERAGSAMRPMLASLRVEAEAVPPPVTEGPGAAGRAIAGFYMGSKGRYVVNLQRPVGYGDWKVSPHFYLFSPDGRVYRGYDFPSGDTSRFDFAAAQRADPENSGRYTVKDGKLHMQLGSAQQPERISVATPRGGRLTIDSVLYVRQ